MQPFAYKRVEDTGSAVKAAAAKATSKNISPVDAASQFIAGGTNLADYMKLGVATPTALIDINALGRSHGRIEMTAAELRLGALVRMADAEDHPDIKREFPVIAETLALAASPQIRNMASLAGNILQRTRCEYFRETSWPCNKREPGSGCSAIDGINREHAVLGGSDYCIATYHGDFAQALIALDASVTTTGASSGPRTLAFRSLHVAPGSTPNVETVLEPGELVTSIVVPMGPHTRRSHYVKVRDRQSYQFAISSAAVALDLDGDIVRDVRIALGGVATIPWRALASERALRGQRLDEASAEAAAEAAFADAKPRKHNAFKITEGKATLVRALLETKQMQVPT